MAFEMGVNSKTEKRKCDDDEDSESEMRRLTANSQERARMQKINKALADLKKCLPEHFHLHHRRMSKIRALRSAMVYIRGLSQLLHEDNMRRQEYYKQAMDYMRFMSDSQHVHSPEMGIAHTVMQTPDSMISCYPCLGPLCADPNSLYGTPDQTPTNRSYNPRALDFSINSGEIQSTLTQHDVSSSTYNDANILVSEMTEDVDKHRSPQLKRPRRYNATSATPLGARIIKSESFTSPLVGDRNDNEMNLSVLSANSDCGHHDNAESRGTIQGIVDDNYQY